MYVLYQLSYACGVDALHTTGLEPVTTALSELSVKLQYASLNTFVTPTNVPLLPHMADELYQPIRYDCQAFALVITPSYCSVNGCKCLTAERQFFDLLVM